MQYSLLELKRFFFRIRLEWILSSNSLPTGVVCSEPLQTDWIQIRHDKVNYTGQRVKYTHVEEDKFPSSNFIER